MEPKQPNKEKALSSLYGGVPAPAKGKMARGKPRSKANPSIVLVDPKDKVAQPTPVTRHPPPPRRLPAKHFKRATVVRKPAYASPSVSVEEEMDDDEDENQQLDEDEENQQLDEDEIYSPNDEDDDNSFDHNDTMSEDDVLGHHQNNEVEQATMDISSGEDSGSAKSKKKQRKEKSPKECIENSPAWEHFEKVMVHPRDDPNGAKVLKAKYNHCNKLYAYAQGSSTSTLNRHWKKCKHRLNKLERAKIQRRLGFKPINASANTNIPVGGDVEFEQAIIKELIAKMIMVHEYSFRMVEHEWFNIVMKYLNPLYQSIGRKAIRAECMRVYKKAKEMLKLELKDVEYISLTTDLWTSNQTLSYMCVVAHYIDADWRMQTRVLAFMELDPPHSGHVIADALWECVTEWKIENKVMSITLDNASNNDVAVRDLKAKFKFRRGSKFEDMYFHVRCCAHIINLVVQDGTACMNTLASNLRETMKYFKKSVGRMHKFVEICRGLDLRVGAHLALDVCTRWSSTYKMIATGLPYKEALKDYAVSDANYKWEPTSEEWKLFELIKPMLFSLSQVTTAFSAQAYPTANIFYPHIVSIKIALVKAMKHKNATYKQMGEAMMDKFNKYWAETNNVMVLATILDPRYKLLYVEWGFNELYDEDTATMETENVRIELFNLFEKFENEKKQSKKGTPSSSKSSTPSNSMPASDVDFQSWRANTTTKSSKSELRNYLEDPGEENAPGFDLLDWWKVNSLRYPVLAKMARRFLTIPASSVSSESTFSTSGRVLDDYRSSLKPVIVESLVCGASYIKGAHRDSNTIVNVDDEEENVETIKLPQSI
ncbi:hypothetical protein ACQ4PT_034568 [Festuca glaucescens]